MRTLNDCESWGTCEMSELMMQRIALVAVSLSLLVIACGPESKDEPGLQWESIDLTTIYPAQPSDLAREEPYISVMPGDDVSLYLRVGHQARLVFDGLVPSSTDAGPLEIVLRPDGGQRRVLARQTNTTGDQSIDLDLEPTSTGVIRLRFTTPASSDGGQQAWRIVAPRVEYLPVDQPRSGPILGTGAGEEGDRPNIIIYLADALRRDSLGVYGSEQQLSPLIDTFAKRATVLEQATAQAPWTRSAVASIFTGLEPHRHGIKDRNDALAPEAMTLAELLSQSGYFTAAAITNGNVGPQFGMDQGFDIFLQSRNKDLSSRQTTDRALEALSGPGFREPFFLYVHNLDPHHPYVIAEPSFEQFVEDPSTPELGSEEVLKLVRQKKRLLDDREQQTVKQLYDAEVAYMDREFGRFLEGIRERGLFDDAVIVFVSDHGEEFWDHKKWGHGISLYQELTAIPLIIKSPGQVEGKRIAAPVGQIDLFTTLLDYAGAAIPPSVDGRSMLAPRTGGVPQYALLGLDGRHAVSISDGQWKLVLLGKKRKRRE